MHLSVCVCVCVWVCLCMSSLVPSLPPSLPPSLQSAPNLARSSAGSITTTTQTVTTPHRNANASSRPFSPARPSTPTNAPEKCVSPALLQTGENGSTRVSCPTPKPKKKTNISGSGTSSSAFSATVAEAALRQWWLQRCDPDPAWSRADPFADPLLALQTVTVTACLESACVGVVAPCHRQLNINTIRGASGFCQYIWIVFACACVCARACACVCACVCMRHDGSQIAVFHGRAAR